MRVTIELDSRWAAILRSPIYTIVSALTGVSVTFAPLFLYWAGQGKFEHQLPWLVVPVCFAIIYLVPVFYFRLGNSIARELRQSPK